MLFSGGKRGEGGLSVTIVQQLAKISTHMRLSRLRDADPLSVEYFLAKDDDGRVPALERGYDQHRAV